MMQDGTIALVPKEPALVVMPSLLGKVDTLALRDWIVCRQFGSKEFCDRDAKRVR